MRLATGVAVPYVEQGDPGPVPIVLLHAWAESSACFDRMRVKLPSSMHVFAFDQRGHGGADKPDTGYALDDCANDAIAFMDAVGIRSAILVGSSSGGYVAQQVALRAPDRVTGLVLVGAPRSLQGRAGFADEVDALSDPVDRQWVRDSLTWFPRYHDIPDWYIEDRVQDGLRVPASVWKAALAGLTDAPPPSESGTITAPTLIVWGELDELLPHADMTALAAAIPGSRLVVYENTGHLIVWEQPERVARDVTDLAMGLPS